MYTWFLLQNSSSATLDSFPEANLSCQLQQKYLPNEEKKVFHITITTIYLPSLGVEEWQAKT